MSDKEKVSGEEVEVVQYQCREIGETGWEECGSEGYNYCNRSALHDTRTLMTVAQHQRIVEALRERLDIMSTCADNYSQMFEGASDERDQLRAEVERLTTDLEAANSMLIETSKAGIELRAQLAQQQGVAGLVEALEFAISEQFGDVPCQQPLSAWVVKAKAALENYKEGRGRK